MARRPRERSVEAGSVPGRTWSKRLFPGSLGALFAVVAGVWHALLLTRATNDNFLHMTLAQQLLAGDWPVRDFFDHGWVLQYVLSAVAQAVAGERLAAEALVVGAAWAVSTYAVFALTHRLTASPVAAALAAALLIVSGARGYSYPKGIVYSVAALMWWGYIARPTASRIVAFGAWAAAAFYWRPDHGVYVAAGLALCVFAAHGLRILTPARCALAGATMAILVSPFLLYVHLVYGLPEYVRAGLVQAQYEHSAHGAHRWPIAAFPGPVVEAAPAGEYAPLVGIRWSQASSDSARREVLTRYGLEPAGAEDGVQRVRLSEASIAGLRALLNEPIVEDTAGIDRSTATIPESEWSAWDRWVFEHPVMRLRVLPSLDGQARGSEIAAAVFYLLPLLAIASAPWLGRRLGSDVTAGRLVAFSLFALLVDAVMIREPIAARAADAVVLPAILLGCLVGGLRNAGHMAPAVKSRVAVAAAAVLAAAALVPTASAGEFLERLNLLAGRWASWERARGAWSEAHAELIALPPLRHYVDRPARVELRFAAYVRACVPATERLLVLWFQPDIYYYSGHLMAQRHLVFVPPWAALEREQESTLAKIERMRPPLALARRSSLDANARASYPGIVAHVERHYDLAATVTDGEEEYLIYGRRDRRPVRAFGPDDWPCFVSEPSVWERVGGA